MFRKSTGAKRRPNNSIIRYPRNRLSKEAASQPAYCGQSLFAAAAVGGTNLNAATRIDPNQLDACIQQWNCTVERTAVVSLNCPIQLVYPREFAFLTAYPWSTARHASAYAGLQPAAGLKSRAG